MTYSLLDYANMVRDRTRVRAYKQAIDRVLSPDTVIMDLGAGTGVFAIYCALRGAKHVYAVDTNPALSIGKMEAIRLGIEDRITFFVGEVQALPDETKVDVIVSDIRGVMPFTPGSREAITHARERFLRPGGILIPVVDTIYCQPISFARWYMDNIERPWTDNDLDIYLPVHRKIQASQPIGPFDRRPDACMDSQKVCEVNYSNLSSAPIYRDLRWEALSEITLHAVLLRFESELIAGVEMIDEVGADWSRVYGRLALPLSTPVHLMQRMKLHLHLQIWPKDTGPVYAWYWKVLSANNDIIIADRQNSMSSTLTSVAAMVVQ